MSNDSWPRLFVIAAVFNFAVGLPMLCCPACLLAVFGMPAMGDLFFVRATGLLVACSGVGYYMVSRAPAANRNLVWLGVIGKLGIVVLFVLHWVAGSMPTQPALLASGDLLFAIVFLRFLQQA